MRKFVLFAFIMLIASASYATTVDTFESGNTIFFKNLAWGCAPQTDGARPVTATVVTFNSTTRHIKLTNLSTLTDCYVDIKCVDANGKRGYFTSNSSAVLVPALGRQSPNTVEFDFATRNLSFIGSVSDYAVNNDNNKLHYIVTGDQGDF